MLINVSETKTKYEYHLLPSLTSKHTYAKSIQFKSWYQPHTHTHQPELFQLKFKVFFFSSLDQSCVLQTIYLPFHLRSRYRRLLSSSKNELFRIGNLSNRENVNSKSKNELQLNLQTI